MTPIDSSPARRRYADVESAYTNGDFAEALNLGLGLLQDLQGPDNQPLRMRLLLLLAHTWLYGLGDQDSAAVAYRQVAEESDEQVLADIAAEGLSRSSAGPTKQTDAPVRTTDATTATKTAASVIATPSTPSGLAPDARDHQRRETLTTGATATTGSPPLITSPIDRPEPKPDPFPPGMSASPANDGAAAPWLNEFGARGARTTSGTGDRPMAANLAPFQQPLSANTSPRSELSPEPSFETSPGSEPKASGHPGTNQATTIGEAAAPEQEASAQPPQGRRSADTVEVKAETVVIASTLSFSPEEEQELAKGLLLVVIS